MTHDGWCQGGWTTIRNKWLLVLGVALAAGTAQAWAADAEVRDFGIYVDNKSVGQYRMTISRRADNGFVMTGKASLRVGLLYRYGYEGTEVWKDGRLQSFKSQSNDNGKKFAVTATAEEKALRVRVNGRERLARADVWLTSYWKLADRKYHNQPVPVLDADTGKDINGHLRYVGLEQVTVAGRKYPCKHFRVTGGPSPVDLWYDGQERLVRQESVEQGHRTVIHLTAVGP